MDHADRTDQMLVVVRRLWDVVWRDSDVSALDELFADRYIRHNASGTENLSRQELKEAFVQYQRVLHAPVTTVDAAAREGEVIFVRATSRGTNIETGRPQVVTWMLSYRFDGDRIAEGWIATIPDVDWER
jgi:predicted SnoaL-like aldol condensation-catalyzing enzyme